LEVVLAPRSANGRGWPQGFSLVEVLIAVALMGLLMIGVLPMFAKSMSNNVEGNQLTEVTSRARAHLEELLGQPFDSPELTVPPGQDQLLVREMWSSVQERWFDEADFPATEETLFSRTTVVRQFNLTALSDVDFELETDEVVPGGSSPALVHVKEIEVRVNSGPPNVLSMLGRSKSINLKVLKAI
jgi:prepilin-type N-terminal cleavage/methylation domain-containing protein